MPKRPVHPVELSDRHIRTLEQLIASGFEVVSFPLFPAHVGVRKDECAALLEPQPAGDFSLVGQPTCLVAGQLSGKVQRPDGVYFVWKSEQLPATQERLARLGEFEAKLRGALAASGQSD